MMKRIFSLLGVALICAATTWSTQTATAADESAELAYRPFTLGLEASTTGLGASVNWRFHDHFGARAGFNYWSMSDDDNKIEGITYKTDLRLMSEPIGLDYYPWKQKTFRITVGVLLNQNQVEGSTAPVLPGTTFVPIGNDGRTYDLGGIGGLNMKVEQMPVSPYVSIGMSFYLDKAKHWSLSGELGVAYTGSPDAALSTGSGAENSDAELQFDLTNEAQQIEDWAEKYQFYPIVKISVNYSF